MRIGPRPPLGHALRGDTGAHPTRSVHGRPRGPRLHRPADHHRHWGRHLHLAGGGHLTATDVPALAHAAGLRERWPEPLYAEFLGTRAPPRAAAVTRAYTTAFFDRFLLGHRRPLLDGPTPRYPEMEFRWTRGR
ncbi:hypothetical protein [Streptomyces sp. B27]|uniref:hypothetical protein n=1 Tax=Streptomyces TaxID=1883 RepID=UPI0019D24BD4|nr:hypothetical protein [Streptomyces sp. B27]